MCKNDGAVFRKIFMLSHRSAHKALDWHKWPMCCWDSESEEGEWNFGPCLTIVLVCEQTGQSLWSITSAAYYCHVSAFHLLLKTECLSQMKRIWWNEKQMHNLYQGNIIRNNNKINCHNGHNDDYNGDDDKILLKADHPCSGQGNWYKVNMQHCSTRNQNKMRTMMMVM